MNYKTDYDWTDLTDEPVNEPGNETFGKKPFTQEEAQSVASRYGMTFKDNCFVLGTKCNHDKLLNQVNYWIANDNLVKARLIMKSLYFTNKMIKAYINDEQNLQREQPETSGYNKLRNKPMPKEFEVRGN